MAEARLNLIGCGRLGRSLLRLWRQSGAITIGELLSRSPASAAAASEFAGAGRVRHALDEMSAADFWLIATPDASIAATAAELSRSGLVRPGDCVFHCSGACASDLLAPLAERGAEVGSAHPVLSFASPQAACDGFAGSHVGIEGLGRAPQRLHALFEAIGGRCFDIDPQHKMLYHAASVFASNFTVVLLDVALRAYGAAGLDPATAGAVMAPLVEGAIGNALRLGPADALSGPAARGDIELVERQKRRVTEWSAEAGRAYEVLSLLAVDLAQRKSR